jgi:hypothetical protein
MGYTTHVDGEIVITPPLAWGEIRDDPYLPDQARESGKCVKFRIVEETAETAEGTLVRRSAVGIIAVREDSFKAYAIGEEVAEIVRRFPDRTFSGRLDGLGSDPGDMWRLYVRDGRVTKDVPRIVWPDGEAVEGRA